MHSGAYSFAAHVADHDPENSVAQRYHVVEVAADLCLALRRDVLVRDLEVADPRLDGGPERVLQGVTSCVNR